MSKIPSNQKNTETPIGMTLSPASDRYPTAYVDNTWDVVESSSSLYNVVGILGPVNQHDINEKLAQNGGGEGGGKVIVSSGDSISADIHHITIDDITWYYGTSPSVDIKRGQIISNRSTKSRAYKQTTMSAGDVEKIESKISKFLKTPVKLREKRGGAGEFIIKFANRIQMEEIIEKITK